MPDVVTRHCATCTNPMSRYHDKDETECWACQEAARTDGGAIEPTPPAPVKTLPKFIRRSEEDIVRDRDTLLDILRAHTTGEFLVENIRQHIDSIRWSTLGHLLNRLEREDELVRLRTVRGSTGGLCVVWCLADRLQEQAS